MSIADEARAEAWIVHTRDLDSYDKADFDAGWEARAKWQASRKPEAAPSDTDQKTIAALIMDHFREGATAGSSWRLNPTAAADSILAAGFSRSQPVQVEVTEASVTVLAKHMANVATDWNHNDCGDDDHPLGHSNWEAYTDDARRALAALGGGDRG